MPKTIHIPENTSYDGVKITWTPTAQRLDICGWYDQIVGIENRSMNLSEFFEKLGITEKDCAKAFRKMKRGEKWK
jgi:hypothetical protein